MKTATAAANNLTDLIPAWEGLKRTTPYFGPIRTERDYARMKSLMDNLLAEVGDDEKHRHADLLDLVSTLVSQYEDTRYPWDDKTSPRQILKFLMDQHDLTQSDLSAEIGSQGVVSEILAGDRTFNARQAKALAKRFGVSPAVFL